MAIQERADDEHVSAEDSEEPDDGSEVMEDRYRQVDPALDAKIR